MNKSKFQKILIIDFGSQYTQLISRRSRDLGFSSLLMLPADVQELFENDKENWSASFSAFILSGGPQSIFADTNDYQFLFEQAMKPVLGICYGMQLMAHQLGGKVERGIQGEYGNAQVTVNLESHFSRIQNKFNDPFSVWMSHFDHVVRIPENFEIIFNSAQNMIAGIKHCSKPWVGVQFHPEVEQTINGILFLQHFLEKLAGLVPDRTEVSTLEEIEAYFSSKKVGHILCAFSGGVDSLVAARLCQMRYGENLHCFFVNHGLQRLQDMEHIKILARETSLKIVTIEAEDFFLAALQGMTDPELKRKTIGKLFIEVFDRKVKEYQDKEGIVFTHLLQGTLYPDVIESFSPHGKQGTSVTIKSHHNVGGLPDKMNLELLEPLRTMFKDEVRKLGIHLGLQKGMVYRHPFPGPGLALRIIGEITKEGLAIVRQSDQILLDEMLKFDCYNQTWQAFTVLLPIRTVGVKGDERVYEKVVAIRMVQSSDGMTASFSRVSFDFLAEVSRRICNEVSGVTRVVYDISSKPPATIEWE